MYVIQRFLKALKNCLMEYQRDVAQIRFSGIIVSCIVGSGTRGDKLQNVENRFYGFEEHFNLRVFYLRTLFRSALSISKLVQQRVLPVVTPW